MIEQGNRRFKVRQDLALRITMAAAAAMAMGWAAAEEWIVDSVGLADRDIGQVRADIDGVLATLMALGQGNGG